ncbi:MAG: alpha/beta hydrolase fold domain-containing protein [Streptosporangiales bacterium]|nr:alpha/beta hydrolase fold domain-containing protein [Streptosporangiales bacterium]
MPLNPQAEALLKQFEEQGLPPFDQMSVPQARDVAMAFRDLQGEPQPVGEVRDLLIPGPAGKLPARAYIPAGEGPLPVLVYFHGGGWVIGNVEVVDRPCRALANATGCVVVSVEYRLSPETKFPGPAEDCYAAARWVAEHADELGADPGRVGVAGDSAGGNLAAVVSLMARDRGGPSLGFQLLIYPVTAPAAGTTFPSYRENAEGYLLTRADMEWFWEHYLAAEDDAKNPYAAPLHADNLADLPRALVVTCGFDPLRDEGAAYAERLREAGVPVTAARYDDMIHGFLWMGGVLDRSQDLLQEIAREVRSAFSR